MSVPLIHLKRATAAMLVLAGTGSTAAWAVGAPSSYPGCATRSVSVAAGASVKVDLAKCHSFGLGVVSRAPTQGTATPGDSDPIDSYIYTHGGGAVTAGAYDSFVVLDDNSDFITVRVALQGGSTALVATPATLPAMSVGTVVQQPLTASGGRAPYAFKLAAGELPAGLKLDAAGLLAGTPTLRGSYSFSVRITDAAGVTADKSYGGTVTASSLSLAPARATATQGLPFSQALAGSGGVAPYRFQLEPGPALPAGLSLSGAGVVSGTTAVSPRDYPVTVRITDASGGTGAQFELETFTVAVKAGNLPLVSLSVSPAAVAEDDGEALVFTVTRRGKTDADLRVNLASTGTAKVRLRRSVLIPAGSASATVRVNPTADDTPEPDETVVVAIAPGAGYAAGEVASASATLVNDDLP